MILLCMLRSAYHMCDNSIRYQTCTPNKQPRLQLETEATEVDVFMVLHPNAAQGLHGYESSLTTHETVFTHMKQTRAHCWYKSLYMEVCALIHHC